MGATIKVFCSTIKVFCSIIKVFCSTIKVFCATIKVFCSTIKVFCATIKVFCATIICLFLYLFFSMPWHFFLSIRVSKLTKFFIPFILFIQRSDFLIFSFFHPSHLRTIHYYKTLSSSSPE